MLMVRIQAEFLLDLFTKGMHFHMYVDDGLEISTSHIRSAKWNPHEHCLEIFIPDGKYTTKEVKISYTNCKCDENTGVEYLSSSCDDVPDLGN